ncbi:Katanin p60 ATPase-containing subunit A-like 2 [Kappamyces sp. JEL0829]|nr:Katanin p60 ATPase-containing subunit A-like 2 [Kappamyces sp. JEL0829]
MNVELSLSKIKTQADARTAEMDRVEARKKHLLVLILTHLAANGYTESCERLQHESGISLAKIKAADNIDLASILQEFETYYNIKFGKFPKLVRKTGADDRPEKTKRSSGPAKESQALYADSASEAKKKTPGLKRELKASALPPIPSPSVVVAAEPARDAAIEAVGTRTGKERSFVAPAAEQIAPSSDLHEDRLLKPIPHFESSELRELAATITRDIFTQNPNVTWDSISGLEQSKRLIKEAIVFPIKFPQYAHRDNDRLFQGLLKPWKGILLYGPPGTGKTMLAKAVATECNTTFFNISASSVVSKWRGDSEKLIRVLFELARYHAPSTIFLDELESIMSHRSSEGGEHEGSRRMKTELLIQMDGLSKSNDLVFLLAASNLPWDLDLAMLRRLEKRILIGLPDFAARKGLFQQLLATSLVEGLDFDELATQTKGYSGSDINLVCRESAMRPLRALFDKLDSYREDAEPALFQPLPIRQQDVLEAIKCTKSSSDEGLRQKYDEWQHSFGSA